MWIEVLSKLSGAASGIALYWAVSPMRLNRRLVLALSTLLVISVVGAPFTAEYMDKFFSVTKELDGLFLSAAFNGIIILPAIKFLNSRSSSPEKEPEKASFSSFMKLIKKEKR